MTGRITLRIRPLNGLDPNDEIIVDPPDSIVTGTLVHIAPANSAAPWWAPRGTISAHLIRVSAKSSSLASATSGEPELERKQRAAAWAICDSNRSSMRLRDFGNDCESETGTPSRGAPTAPEALKNVFTIRLCYARSPIGNRDHPAFRDGDGNLGASG